MSIVLTNRDQAKDVRHVEGTRFLCCKCHEIKPVGAELGTGYASLDNGDLMCYACCAEVDKQHMLDNGKIVLYLTCESAGPITKDYKTARVRSTWGKISNWPGTLEFPCYTTTGFHNIAGIRYNAWFTGPDGYEWHGVTYGSNTQLCHCRRTKTVKNQQLVDAFKEGIQEIPQ